MAIWHIKTILNCQKCGHKTTAYKKETDNLAVDLLTCLADVREVAFDRAEPENIWTVTCEKCGEKHTVGIEDHEEDE